MCSPEKQASVAPLGRATRPARVRRARTQGSPLLPRVAHIPDTQRIPTGPPPHHVRANSVITFTTTSLLLVLEYFLALVPLPGAEKVL